jgi:hypothetical protein
MNTPAPLKMSPDWRLLALLILLLTACTSGPAARGEEGDDIIGKPPPKTEDPFSVTALPPPDARAPATGAINAPATPPARESTHAPKPEPVTPPAPKPDAAPAARVEPAKELPQCFSCVRICPITDLSPDCSESREDVICGWGAGEDEDAARKLARAECNAALDMAREMPRFSSIDGSCPVASCR